METCELARQLTEIYECEENWHRARLSHEEALDYHKKILESGNCITLCDEDKLIGYVEFYVTHGVCYVQNLFIRVAYRNTKAIRMIKNRLFQVIGKCRVIVGDRNKNATRYPEYALRRI